MSCTWGAAWSVGRIVVDRDLRHFYKLLVKNLLVTTLGSREAAGLNGLVARSEGSGGGIRGVELLRLQWLVDEALTRRG